MNWRAPALALALVALASGCGGDDIGKLVPVEGTVKKGGQPYAKALLTFVPDPSNKVQTSGTDLTGEDGSFSAKYRNRPGLAPGKYKVLVVYRGDAKGPGGAMPSDITQSPYMAGLASAKGAAEPPKEDVYATVEKTPLSVEVSENGEKGLLFEIK